MNIEFVKWFANLEFSKHEVFNTFTNNEIQSKSTFASFINYTGEFSYSLRPPRPVTAPLTNANNLFIARLRKLDP